MAETRKSARAPRPTESAEARETLTEPDEISNETLTELAREIGAEVERESAVTELSPSGNTWVDHPAHLDNAISNATVSPPVSG